DNNLEFYKQYHVRFHPAHRAYMEKRVNQLEAEIAAFPAKDTEAEAKARKEVAKLKADIERYSMANFEALPRIEREIHQRAFVTNTGDPHYHELETIRYTDEVGEKSVQVPKGDIFYQFRKDVDEGRLPTVSWLVAPCN